MTNVCIVATIVAVSYTHLFDQEQLKSYDSVNAKTYILDAGDYYITAAKNAHEAVNNILSAKGKTVADGMTADGDTAFVATYTPANGTVDTTTYKLDTDVYKRQALLLRTLATLPTMTRMATRCSPIWTRSAARSTLQSSCLSTRTWTSSRLTTSAAAWATSRSRSSSTAS